MKEEKHSRAHRRNLCVFLLIATVVFGAMYVLLAALNTLRQLDAVEAARDDWQRPADILKALDLREGNVVVDLGSGAGYFALKLSQVVGGGGEVFAVDVRKLSLSFLWIRAVFRSPRNIYVVVGEDDDPHLPNRAVDAVLIANTYHEFRQPRRMLECVFRSLRPGGRLVIVDRGPPPQSYPDAAPGHQISIRAVEGELRQYGFEIVSREDPFIDRAGDDPWWRLVAQKP